MFVISLVCATGGCRNTPRSAEPGADAGAPTPNAAASPSGVASSVEDTEIQPVYPLDAGPPQPLVTKLCDAMLGLPVKRRAECCNEQPGFSAAGECVRTLTHALRVRAVELSAPDVDRCVGAAKESTTGCGWVGSSPPPVPEACRSVISGVLPAGTRCRSSLECATGLHCHGLTATRPGVCGRPRPEGAPCGGGIDTLAAYTAQTRLDTRHPECDGAYCASGRCLAFTAAGGACTSNAQCGLESSCRAGRCSALKPPGPGQPCVNDECAELSRCVRGVCVLPKNGAESCESDAECRGACLRPERGGVGRCGMRCPKFTIPTAAPSAKRVDGKRR